MTRTDLPTGTVTFFFSDMEGSTKLVQELGAAWPALLADHDELMRTAIHRCGGVEVRTEGDSFFVVFLAAADAVAVAAAAQRAMQDHGWPGDRTVRIRIGIHTGTGALGGSDYVGLDVHRAARIAAAAHGGQVILSETTAVLAERLLPEGADLRDLGKHRLKDLLEREALFQLVLPGVSDEFPPPRTLESIPNNLPVQFTSFVGREDEISSALEMLGSTRILTLLGPGGTGKTRLSIQVAAEAADRFGDGVYFIPLAPVSDGDLIAPTILSILGVAPASASVSPRDQLARFLSDKSVLLVLDNFEQLVDSAALVGDLAAASPRSTFLVSSRIPLRLRGEQQLAIPPLEVIPANSDVDALMRNEAVHLFVERAQAVQPGFALTEDNAPSVVELVRRLDGLPLAIELAVSKLKLLTVEALLERFDGRTLTGGPRDAPERHQTMWNAIAWSEEALTEPCRRLFARMSLLLGGARLEEIEQLCEPEDHLGMEAIDGLATLVDSSLVLADRTTGRFRMLQVIREYAAARLAESGEAEEIGRRHTSAYLDRIEAAVPELTRRDRKLWVESLDADHDNLRSAMARCVAGGDTDRALRFCWAMWRFWQIRGHLHEGRRRVDEALAMPGGDPKFRAKAIEALGGIAWWQGDGDACTTAYDEALRLQRELGDDREIANALYNAGLMESFFRQQLDRGNELLEEAMAIYTRLGDEGGLADVHWGRGNLALAAADDPRAGIANLERCIELYQAVGNVFGEGWGRFELGEIHRRSGDFAEARDHFTRGMELLYGTGEISAAVFFLLAFAALSRLEGDDHRGARLGGAAWALGERSGVDLVSNATARIEGVEKETLEALTGDLADAYRAGLAMTPDEAVAYALGSAGASATA